MESFSVDNDKIDEVVQEMLVIRKYTDIVRETDKPYRFSCLNGTKKVVVTYIFNRKKLPLIFKKYIEEFSEKDYHHIIILYNAPSSLFKKIVQPYNVELFSKQFMKINITKHYLVPKHTLIKNTSNEIQDIMEEYQLQKPEQLPLILSTDPITQFYGAQVGDIFKITRPSQTNGTYTTYRYVNTKIY